MSYNNGYRSGSPGSGGSGYQSRQQLRPFKKYGNNSNNYNNQGNYYNSGYKSYNNNNTLGDQNSSSYRHGGGYPNGNSRNTARQSPAYSNNDSLQIWMGDLDPKWDEKFIIDIWTAQGETPTAVKILRSDPYKPPYCFVTFTSQQGVKSAIQKNGQQIPGMSKVFKLNWASGGANNNNNNNNNNDSFGSVPQRNTFQPNHTNNSHADDQTSLFVGDLAPDLTEAILYNAFQTKYPNQIKQAKIMIDPSTNNSKGFGFIRFTTLQTQQQALKEMNGVNIGGRPIRLALASRGGGGSTTNDQSHQPHVHTGGGASSHSQAASKSESPALSHTVNTTNLVLNVNYNLPQTHPPLNKYTDPFNTTILIQGISGKLNEYDLLEIFTSFGDIVYCIISDDLQTASIRFYHRISAERAIIAFDKMEVKGHRLLLNWGISESTKPGTKIAFQPNNSKIYKREPEPPVQYGTFGKKNLVFNKLNDEEREKLSSSSSEPSEPVSIGILNRRFIQAKLDANDLLLF